jgi:hypothetical protein
MKRLMLIAASLVLVGGFMVGCEKKTESEKLMGEIGTAAEEAKDDAAAAAEEAKKDADKAATDAKKALGDL